MMITLQEAKAMEYTRWLKDELGLQIDPRLEVMEVGIVGAEISDSVTEHGLKAHLNIPAGSTLVILPFSSTITTETVTDLPGLSLLRGVLSEDDLLSLLILHETKKEVSKWSQHFSYIPKVYHSVANFTVDEVELLKGSNLHVLTKKWQLQITDDYQRLINTIQGVLGADTEHPQLTIEEYRWALCTIWSRCLTIERNGTAYRALVPFVDLCNHRPNAQIGHALHPQSDSIYLFAGEESTAGAEIHLNYGNVGNARLLMLYGFTLPLDQNPFTTVELYASLGEDVSLEELNMRKELLRRQGLWDENNHRPNPFKLAHNQLPQELLTFLRIQHLPTVAIRRLFDDESVSLESVIVTATDIAVFKATNSSLQEMLDAYPTTLIEDEEALQNQSGMSHRQFHCRQLVYTEKQILHSVKELLQHSKY